MSESDRSLAVTLRVAAVRPCPEDSTWVCCLSCGEPLELFQPDTEEPRRFVGNCDACGRWYLVDWDPRKAEGLTILLPNYEVDRDVLGQVVVPVAAAVESETNGVRRRAV